MISNRQECKEIYGLDDEQINYLLLSAIQFIKGIQTQNLPTTYSKEGIINAINRNDLITTHNMTPVMANAFVEYVLPKVWEKLP